MIEIILIYIVIALLLFRRYMLKKDHQHEKVHCAVVCALWFLIPVIFILSLMFCGKRTSQDAA